MDEPYLVPASVAKWMILAALFVGPIIGLIFGLNVHGSLIQACKDSAKEATIKVLGNITQQIQYGVLK